MPETKIINLDKYDISQATHKLMCRHQIGKNGFNYTMPCVVLGRTKSRKLKIIVFGSRFWKYRKHIKKIRYVSPFRVKANR